MFKRLSEPTGAVTDNSSQPGDTDNQIVRPAILVHAGPNNGALEFMSGDGPIRFDAERIKKVVDVHNAYLDELAKQYGGEDKIPMGAYEPILDSHETESNDRVIGRLTGRLKYEVRDVPKVGVKVPCAVAQPGITFLGKETVEKVKDGRIYHLSIGISEKTNRLGETSTVVKPAAPGAMLLGDGKKTRKGGLNMSVDIKRMKAHTEKLAKLSAMKESFGDFTKKLVATSDVVKMTQKKGQITHRLTEAMRSGKLTPGEYKTLCADNGLTKLAALDDATLKIALMPIEAREHRVIIPGQIGSSSTNDFSDMAKDMAKQKDQNEFKRLRAEFNTDMKRMTGHKLAADAQEEKDYKKELSGPQEAPVNPGKDGHVVPGQAGDEKQLAHHLSEMGKHLAAGDLESAKKCHAAMSHMAFGGPEKKMAEFTGDVHSEDAQKGMMEMQKQVDDLNTQMSRMAGMVEEMMAAEAEEGEHFGKISEEHAGVAS